MAANLIAMTSNLLAMAANLLAMAFTEKDSVTTAGLKQSMPGQTRTRRCQQERARKHDGVGAQPRNFNAKWPRCEPPANQCSLQNLIQNDRQAPLCLLRR